MLKSVPAKNVTQKLDLLIFSRIVRGKKSVTWKMLHPDDSVPNAALCWSMIEDANFSNAHASIIFALFVWRTLQVKPQRPVETKVMMAFVRLHQSKDHECKCSKEQDKGKCIWIFLKERIYSLINIYDQGI